MREVNDVQNFINIDDECCHDVIDMGDVQNSTDFLDVNNEKFAHQGDSGILYDDKASSKYSINSYNESSASNVHKHLLKDSGIVKNSIREFPSKQSLSIKSSSVSAVAAISTRESSRTASKIRNKRYSLPDIDKLKQYHNLKQSSRGKSANIKYAEESSCDNESVIKTAAIPLEDTRASSKIDNFTIDPKLINKYDGLSQSLYFIDENGSPKIRERYIKQQRLFIEKQEQKRREKEIKISQAESCSSCFNFGRLSKKLKELCKYILR